ncbi:hypothetical protein C3747_281g6 [Trypanosoma cruzi]|uniref:Uncharacterized protein n=2 Tax=Trypanosoma cruzi TaxID=5693 RepID=Q4DG58_TRYCC|nr:hypothetical protein, conserved [Trypanosoma cruzi]EAN91501.1 hypothetical protein, conserved [Trypanosoma cruzi]KAF5217373.1 hypothetical protein ECC02_009750 [Trypanosoma cruzi]KAF8302711.1 hypothetical protein TcYC6_0045060 [Trypanosoma cruzi]PWU94172.1 hypothetical protein C3747_281g6 [Trypanosoma cruzi]RNC56248.1 hypothetical protein TcCL_ESM06241 [Trypanosoma cruzi]|eukprot:XP_813352.1 hypothetical protein [Trypanosoma cruzi strain CL Brener]
MLANIGLESESRVRENRIRGRRHVPRDETFGQQPTYMTAPFAVQQEPLRNPRSTAMPLPQDILMSEENEKGSFAANYDIPQPQLGEERLSKSGLNIFSWNTEAPKALPSRVRRERDAEELLRLKPLDAEVQRDIEVREKFEGNTHSRFLCFSQDGEAGKQLGSRGRERHRLPQTTLASAPVLDGISCNPNPTGDAVPHGRRRFPPTACPNEGIAGFAGMGMGGFGRPHKPVGNGANGF